MGTCWNRLITSYSGHFLACQGVDCTFRWKGLIGNDNLLTEGICQPTSPGCLSASTATISTGRLADRSCCQRPQAQGCSSISPALVFASARVRGTIAGCVQVALKTLSKQCTHKQLLIINTLTRKGERHKRRWASRKLKCFQTIRAVQQDPGHQSHLNIFHSWGHKMQDDMTDTQ